jgi:hypothetical protein
LKAKGGCLELKNQVIFNQDKTKAPLKIEASHLVLNGVISGITPDNNDILLQIGSTRTIKL